MAMSDEKQEKMVLCGANSYDMKYYFNEKFNGIPESVKNELHILCVLFTEEVGGIFTIGFDEEGNVLLETNADDDDIYYDDISSGFLLFEFCFRTCSFYDTGSFLFGFADNLIFADFGLFSGLFHDVVGFFLNIFQFCVILFLECPGVRHIRSGLVKLTLDFLCTSGKHFSYGVKQEKGKCSEQEQNGNQGQTGVCQKLPVQIEQSFHGLTGC